MAHTLEPHSPGAPGQEILPTSGTCRLRLSEGPPCNGDFAQVMSFVMCNAWYSVPPEMNGEPLVEMFKANLQAAFAGFREACQRP